MPYKSKRKRALYARKWRHTHPAYMTQHGRAYREGVTATCLLGRRTNAPDSAPMAAQSGAEVAAGLMVPAEAK